MDQLKVAMERAKQDRIEAEVRVACMCHNVTACIPNESKVALEQKCAELDQQQMALSNLQSALEHMQQGT